MSSEIRHFYEFGDFRLDADKRILWRNGDVVALPPKAAEVLVALVERRGDLLERSELLDKVWKDTFVEEGNLSYTISNLRRTLGTNGDSGYIQTVPRRGYRFTAELHDAWVDLGPDIVIDRKTISETLIEEIHTVGTPDVVIGNRSLIIPTKRVSSRHALVAGLAAATVIVAALAWQFAIKPAEVPKDIRSIAVLPFKTIDDSSRNSHRGLGLADILITRLSGLKRVAVRPMSSVTRFENVNTDSVAFGKEIGVDAVLEGTVYQTGDDIRVTVRFVSVGDGKAIWTGEFAKPLADELLLQSEIALRVADGLTLNLDPQERQNLTKRYTENREAYESYLRGRFLFDKRDASLYPNAIDEYEHAIELDPKYALAFSGMADAYAMQANEADDARRNELYEKARTTLEQALALDDQLAEAHTSLAWIKRIHDWDWEGSEREFKRALELDPNYYNAHMWYSFLLLTLNRKDEALAEIEKARELAPLTPSVVANYHTVRFFRQDNDQLLEIAEQEKKLGVREYITVRTHSQTYLRLGEYDKVISILSDFYSRNKGRYFNTLDANLAAAYALSGRLKEAQVPLRRLADEAAQNTEAGYRLSTVLSDLGRNDEVLDLLEKCVAARDDRLLWVAVEPRFERLRDEPRFKAILKKMNLPDA